MAAEEEATSGEVDCTPSPPKESPPAKRAKVGPKVDVASTESVFTPARKGRVKKKIRGLSDGPLRGGEFVANVDKNFCTLSFCFAKTESDDSGKEVTTWYGVTAGHLAEKGDSIYVCTGYRSRGRSGQPHSLQGRSGSVQICGDRFFDLFHKEG